MEYSTTLYITPNLLWISHFRQALMTYLLILISVIDTMGIGKKACEIVVAVGLAASTRWRYIYATHFMKH